MSIVHYDIPDDLHRALKIRAAERGITLKALIIELLSAVLRNPGSQPTEEGDQR